VVYKNEQEARAAVRPDFEDKLFHDEMNGRGWYVFRGPKKNRGKIIACK
jgi:hypothetical protein